ncbi:FMN-binding protein [Schaalia hyovaginalis]
MGHDALVSEAIAAQSAQVDSISGASFTSEGFKEALQSALDQAGFNA